MTPETTEETTSAANRPPTLTKTHKRLIGVVVVGAVIIAGIGFAGSYTAVRDLAVKKDFGDFSYVFPIGIDAGIVVLLALDLLLTWMRMRFPLLRQTAWLLTAATIAFNGAAAWPDPLGVGMHAVIPILFVVSVEAARHAVGRVADITADKHMEGVRLSRWLLSPGPTFLLWRRMKLWELRSYEQVIKLEQDRYVYQTWLESEFGKNWRKAAKPGKKGGAPVELLMPLRLARYGKPLSETVPAVLIATGREVPALFQPQQRPELEKGTQPEAGTEQLPQVEPEQERPAVDAPQQQVEEPEFEPVEEPEFEEPEFEPVPDDSWQQQGPAYDQREDFAPYGAQQPEPYGPAHRYGDPVASYDQQVEASVPEAAYSGGYGPYAQPQPAPVEQPEPFVEPQPAAVEPERVVEPEPVAVEPVYEIPQQPEPVAAAAPARSTAPARVQAKVEDLVEDGGAQPVRTWGNATRDLVAETYRSLPAETRALRGRPLAAAIVEASGNALKLDTVRRTHISEELLAEYEKDLTEVPSPRQEQGSEGGQ
ncbi:DUF2637 domain-containing protein [Streptomyces sp. NBC_00239]|uniref:DUF2637 domain-containing protein n=1 Tax=Streptomyces sp. NBC_00239 TaxID=2903640 RepID=UPI002E2BB9D1|nr:DUF2637 domain-containing protein [Streptomyces sp. NBC_00239]